MAPSHRRSASWLLGLLCAVALAVGITTTVARSAVYIPGMVRTVRFKASTLPSTCLVANVIVFGFVAACMVLTPQSFLRKFGLEADLQDGRWGGFIRYILTAMGIILLCFDIFMLMEMGPHLEEMLVFCMILCIGGLMDSAKCLTEPSLPAGIKVAVLNSTRIFSTCLVLSCLGYAALPGKLSLRIPRAGPEMATACLLTNILIPVVMSIAMVLKPEVLVLKYHVDMDLSDPLWGNFVKFIIRAYGTTMSCCSLCMVLGMAKMLTRMLRFAAILAVTGTVNRLYFAYGIPTLSVEVKGAVKGNLLLFGVCLCTALLGLCAPDM